jgi:hypothetical protein
MGRKEDRRREGGEIRRTCLFVNCVSVIRNPKMKKTPHSLFTPQSTHRTCTTDRQTDTLPKFRQRDHTSIKLIPTLDPTLANPYSFTPTLSHRPRPLHPNRFTPTPSPLPTQIDLFALDLPLASTAPKRRPQRLSLLDHGSQITNRYFLAPFPNVRFPP